MWRDRLLRRCVSAGPGPRPGARAAGVAAAAAARAAAAPGGAVQLEQAGLRRARAGGVEAGRRKYIFMDWLKVF